MSASSRTERSTGTLRKGSTSRRHHPARAGPRLPVLTKGREPDSCRSKLPKYLELRLDCALHLPLRRSLQRRSPPLAGCCSLFAATRRLRVAHAFFAPSDLSSAMSAPPTVGSTKETSPNAKGPEKGKNCTRFQWASRAQRSGSSAPVPHGSEPPRRYASMRRFTGVLVLHSAGGDPESVPQFGTHPRVLATPNYPSSRVEDLQLARSAGDLLPRAGSADGRRLAQVCSPV